MTKFKATLTLTEYRVVEFEARDYEHAQSIAGDQWDSDSALANESDWVFGVHDVEEIKEISND